MIEERDALGVVGKMLVWALSAGAAAWATVLKLWGSKMSSLERQVKANADASEERWERQRAEHASELRRLEGKVDRHYEALSGHLIDIKGRLK